MSKWFKGVSLGMLSLLIAAVIWLPALHLFFRGDFARYFSEEGIGQKTDLLAQRQIRVWTDPDLRDHEIRKMRGTNAEWDFMARTFLCWSLANMALRNPTGQRTYIEVIDRILDETLRIEQEEGHFYFLMDYALGRDFTVKPNRSLFVDGEIALIMAMRRMVEEKPIYVAPMRERIEVILSRMEQSPVLSAESYPSECWMFCNTAALAAIKMGDVLDGTDHSEFLSRWVRMAKEKLVHKKTGLLVSSYDPDGRIFDGPEGSSIWMASHCLQIVDPGFAREQYELARKELGVSLLGFGYAREWPRTWENRMDVDSGPVVPLLEASAGSSGLAFLGAATFRDRDFLKGLVSSLNFAGFPIEKKDSLKYCASNQVGDAVLLYSMTMGPIWKKVLEKGQP